MLMLTRRGSAIPGGEMRVNAPYVLMKLDLDLVEFLRAMHFPRERWRLRDARVAARANHADDENRM